MSRPRLILHVGPHKTGSTALQHRLLHSRPLLQQHGYDYPELGLSQFAHHRIYSFLKGDLAHAGDVTEDAIRALATLGRNLIVSSEDLIYLPPEKLAYLKQLVGGFDVTVVIYIRTPIELWPSHWQELVKHGRSETLIEYVGSYFGITNVIDPRFMHPVSQATRFAQAFGRENIRLFCYDNIIEEGGDIVNFFLSKVAGIEPPHPGAAQKTLSINRSLRPDVVEILRSMNERAHKEPPNGFKLPLAGAYIRAQADIEADPGYNDFRARFEQHALSISLDSSNDFFRNRERLLARTFGDRIENMAAPDQVFSAQIKKTITYGARYWTERFGLRAYVSDLVERLTADAR